MREILELYERMKGRITELTRSKHALRVLDSLFDRPIFPSSDFLKRSGISRPTGLEFLRKLRDGWDPASHPGSSWKSVRSVFRW